MQITFYDSENDDLTPQAKGQLFEGLVKRLAEMAGYQEIELRKKRNSLEYDVSGSHQLTARRLLGEAKAHERTMEAKEVTAFVGKVLPQMFSAQVDGLFVSTSILSAEAEDYLRSLGTSPLPGTFRTLAGTAIPDFLATAGSCLTDATFRTAIRNKFGLEPLDTWLVVSNRADFLLATCGTHASGESTSFATLSVDGRMIEWSERELRRLKAQIPEIREIDESKTARPAPPPREGTRIAGIVAGTGWFDYKFPAAPDYFVGRVADLDDVRDRIAEIGSKRTSVRAIQILSRSGVGKSSFLLKVPTVVPETTFLTLDARSMRVPSDVRLVCVHLVQAVNDDLGTSLEGPSSQEEIQPTLEAAGALLGSRARIAAVQIDQSESLLARPTVFDALLDAIETTTLKGLPIVWILARKNDVATTYDAGSSIDLPRLNELSVSIGLDDFSPVESRTLLGALSTELREKIDPRLTDLIQTFSAGFPWLLKRLGAHVISMHRDGVPQRDLLANGLLADDLFDEDLAGLSEQDRSLLKLFAANLPSTAAELGRRLEAEVSASRLTQKLNEFLGAKLLRLTGDTYDTYNDVFKTYLITDRIPFQSRYVFRVGPGGAMPLFDQLKGLGRVDLASFHGRIGGSHIAMLNKLRELRLLGLISPERGWVSLSPDARAAIESGTLAEFIRKGLRANGLVVRVLDSLASRGALQYADIAAELKSELPHVDVSPSTWMLYAQLLTLWLHYAGLVDVDGGIVTPRAFPGHELGGERAFHRGSFADGTFLPSVRPKAVVQLLKLLAEHGSMTAKQIKPHFRVSITPGLLRDASALDLIDEASGRFYLGAQGRVLVERPEGFGDRDVAVLALPKANIRALLQGAEERPLDRPAQREILTRFGSASWTDRTWQWRIGILRTWMVATGLVTSGRSGMQVRPRSALLALGEELAESGSSEMGNEDR